MNEFDKRQLLIMQSKIKDFMSHRLHISNFIYDLEALLNLLEEKDQKWNSLFREYWWDLEQVYALAIDRDEFSFTPEENLIISEAVASIQKLVELKLDKKKEFYEKIY